MVDLIKQKPEKVVDFIIKWCNNEGREIEKQNDTSHLPPSEDSFIMEEEEELNLEEIKKKQRKTKKKNGISAEAYGEYNKMKAFEPRVIEKTDEQKEMIKSIL